MPRKGKLTLSIDRDVIRRAKALARRWGTSVSALVEKRLRGLTDEEPRETSGTSIVSELRGILPRDASVEEHRLHLEQKHSP
ncbi:MAG TPA: DUF6364 family protein [Gemmatimonadota bacterium]|nr:DUF6364 family protein [Gemmatimonadota bacterium]